MSVTETIESYSIGQQLRDCRHWLGLTLSQVASILGTDYQQIQKYEKGTNQISAARSWRWLEFLEDSYDDFFKNSPTTTFVPKITQEFTKTERELVNNFRLLPPEQQKEFRKRLAEAAEKAIDVHAGKRIGITRRRIHPILSQQRVSEVVGVSYQQISRYEGGARISTDGLLKIAEALNAVPQDFFIDIEGNALPKNPRKKFTYLERALIRDCRLLSETDSEVMRAELKQQALAYRRVLAN